jgi:ketosteroid isomerase-like protein
MNPAEVIEAFAARMSTGEVEAALDLYDENASFVVEPGRVVTGRDAIGAALQEFAALTPTLDGDIEQVVEVDGLALVANRWTLHGVGPDGSAVTMQGRSADLLRRAGSDWRILIDDPWGGGL